jgi:hypothetical protein
VVATRYTFGLKRGVGMDTVREFFVRLRLQHHLSCSPTALRGVMQALERTIVETAQAWEQEGAATDKVREMIGAGDQPFLEHMVLVCMTLPSGYLLVEAVAAERTYAPWKAVVDERLKALGTTVLSLVSDRTKALSQLVETDFKCLSMPDCFPLRHDSVKSYSLAIGRKLNQTQQELSHAEARLARRQDNREGALLGEARRAEVTRWTEVQRTYRPHLEPLSILLPPFSIDDATTQTSTPVARRSHAEVEAIEALATRH